MKFQETSYPCIRERKIDSEVYNDVIVSISENINSVVVSIKRKLWYSDSDLQKIRVSLTEKGLLGCKLCFFIIVY